MFENIAKFFKKMVKSEQQETKSKDTAKERLHLVLMQDRANVSADFLELMKQEIIEVIKKYIEVDDKAIDVRLTNKVEEDGTNGSPFLYANIPIVKIKNDVKEEKKEEENAEEEEPKKELEENDNLEQVDLKDVTKEELNEEEQKEQENETEKDEEKQEEIEENIEKEEIEEQEENKEE